MRQIYERLTHSMRVHYFFRITLAACRHVNNRFCNQFGDWIISVGDVNVNESGFIGPPDCVDERRNIPEALRVDFRKAARCCAQKDSEMPHVENDRIVESTNEARAGVTGQNVNYVLLISTVAVIVLFAVAYLVMSS
jgi:hypothetical protein